MTKYTIRERANGTVLASGVLNETVHQIEDGWYFDPHTVDLEHLRITERIYTCPYKGVCHWIDLDTPQTRAQNVAWVYQNPKSGYESIKGYIGFWNRDTQGTILIEES